ncbi:hypothetical protein F7R05_06840 [Pseudomonas koreensis]|nr:hypothetical protein F7R05_06840 [Pseudomonas koreensis]
MGGKLQNFAKAAILAIVRGNCSIDDRVSPRWRDSRVIGALRTQVTARQCHCLRPIIVNNRDDCITLFNSAFNLPVNSRN